MGIFLNTTSNNAHVPKIERNIQTVKECTRAKINLSPFKCLPTKNIFWLNAIPPWDRLSWNCQSKNHRHWNQSWCKETLQSWIWIRCADAQVLDNSVAPRIVGIIALCSTENDQRGLYFYSLGTGHRINRYSWITLPMPEDVTWASKDLVCWCGLLTWWHSGLWWARWMWINQIGYHRPQQRTPARSCGWKRCHWGYSRWDCCIW